MVALGVELLIGYPNINKINAIWFVLIIIIGLGINDFVGHACVAWWGMGLCLVVLFATFCGTYFTVYNDQIKVKFNDGLMESITYAKQISAADATIDFSAELYQPYIYCLIVDAQSPDEFLATRQFSDYKIVTSYGRYRFGQEIDELAAGKTYVMPISEFNAKFRTTGPAVSHQVYGNFVVVQS